MNGICTVVKLLAHLEHHALIDVETLRCYFIHNLAVLSCINDAQIAYIFANINDLAVGITGRAFSIINQQYLFSFHLLSAALL